jgi:hypothetical protein
MLHGLGIEPPDTAMGRPLAEAFVGGGPVPAWRERTERASSGSYSQEMTVAEVGGARTSYLRSGKRTS